MILNDLQPVGLFHFIAFIFVFLQSYGRLCFYAVCYAM